MVFDKIAKDYDSIWTSSAVGRLQRAAVWRHLDPLVKPGDRILDLGCGTGEDALHLMELGAAVHAIDVSSEMVRLSRNRGIDAHHLAIESLGVQPAGSVFTGALSNFGALNCVRDLESVALALGRLIRPGGYLALCIMGSRCLWESCYFLMHGELRKAFRRWWRDGTLSSLGVHVTYPSIIHLRHAFGRWFKLTRWLGIGLCVPPSYVKHLSGPALARLAGIDAKLAGLPLLRALSDHRLLLFERL